MRLKVLNTALNTQVQSDKFIRSKVRTNKYQNKVVKTTTRTVEKQVKQSQYSKQRDPHYLLIVCMLSRWKI